jgi:hypothetical protein
MDSRLRGNDKGDRVKKFFAFILIRLWTTHRYCILTLQDIKMNVGDISGEDAALGTDLILSKKEFPRSAAYAGRE